MTSPTRKIAFLSPHCVLDFANGAATATLDALSLLARSGFECLAFCNTRIDAPREVLVDEILAKRQLPYKVRDAEIGRYKGRMIFTSQGRVRITLFNSASTRGTWKGPDEIAAFLTGCEIFLRRNRPDVVMTYGGDPVSLIVQQIIKRLGITIVFGLHNFNYRHGNSFRFVDHVTVPSEFSRAFYWQSLGLQCHRLPYVIDPERVECGKGPQKKGLRAGDWELGQDKGMRKEPGLGTENCKFKSAILELREKKAAPRRGNSGDESPHSKLRYVTFVNPQKTKGLYVFARIAEVLARRRPDIPLLVVEGRNGPEWTNETGIDLAALGNVTVRPNTTDPRTIYADTKLILVPSLWNESFGLVADEGMMNGIPVLASNRGALTETVGGSGNSPEADGTRSARSVPAIMCGKGGFLFDIPAKYTPQTRDVPTAEEVEPWVETIIRLWDDAAGYERRSRAARSHARQWHPDRLAPTYGEFFSSITQQPGPPLVPQEVVR